MNLQLNLNGEINKTLELHGYNIIRPIGSGGTCTVFLVSSTKYEGQEFVVKIISNSNRETTKMSEIKSLMNLSHPHIINMYEYFVDRQNLYIVLEYCPGGSLNDIIEANGKLSGTILIQYCKDIISGLDHCHKNHIAHLDIKPQNILIDRYGRLKLADFGLSMTLDHCNSSRQFAGSRMFMAPEIFQKQEFDPFAADIWSLGVTFYVMATGESPWGNCSKLGVEKAISIGLYYYPKDIDPDFLQVIKRMIELNPKDRITTEQLMQVPIFKHAIPLLIKPKGSVIKSETFNLKISARLPGEEHHDDRKLRKKFHSLVDHGLVNDNNVSIANILIRHGSIPISKKRQFKVRLNTFYD